MKCTKLYKLKNHSNSLFCICSIILLTLNISHKWHFWHVWFCMHLILKQIIVQTVVLNVSLQKVVYIATKLFIQIIRIYIELFYISCIYLWYKNRTYIYMYKIVRLTVSFKTNLSRGRNNQNMYFWIGQIE